MDNAEPWHDEVTFWKLRGPFYLGPEMWERIPREVDGILGLLDLPPGAAVLDLCCGPGRHSLELARRGFRVTGVDHMDLFLDEARERAAAEELAIEFVRADMREFRREKGFDAALNMFSAFGYFEDQADDRRVVRNLHASLRPGGKVLVDVMGKEVLAKRFSERHWREKDGVIFLTEARMDLDWTFIRNHETYIVGTDRYVFDTDHRVYSGAELKALLAEGGFGDLKCYGSAEGAPYDQNAQRLMVVGTK